MADRESSEIPRGMGTIHVALIGLLLVVSAASVAEEPWELYEERLVAREPLEMIFVARLPSSQACHAKAAELWNSPVPAGVTRLGYTCLPASPAPGPRTGAAGRRAEPARLAPGLLDRPSGLA